MSRIRANQITNQSADGAPTVQNGLVISGVTTSTTFSGSGASLTNLPSAQLTGALPALDGSNLTGLSGVSVANQADNRLITATGTTDALNGEAGLTYNTTELAVNGDITLDNGGSAGLNFKRSGVLKADIEIGSSSGELAIRARDSSGFIKLTTGSSDVERLRIDSAGRFLKGLTGSGASRSSTSVRYPHFQLSSPWTSGLGSLKIECTDDYPIIFIDSNASYANGSGAGVITWSVKDGSGDYCNTASVRSLIDNTPSNDSAPGRLEFMTTTSGTSPTTKMTISSEGYVTKPNHPSFCARHQSGSGFSGDIIVLTRISNSWDVWNIGGHYSTSTGKFTVPVAGVYYFEGQLMTTGHSNGDNIQDMFSLESNRGRITYVRQRESYFSTSTNANGYYTNSCGSSVRLAAGDTVWLQRHSNQNWGYSNRYYSYFTGWLIG